MQPVSEPGRLDLGAEVPGGVAVEIEVAELAPGTAGPAAVVPWTGNDEVQMTAVVGFEQLVDFLRPVEVFLVPPAGDVQVGHGGLPQVLCEGLFVPELVSIGMLYEVVPRR